MISHRCPLSFAVVALLFAIAPPPPSTGQGTGQGSSCLQASQALYDTGRVREAIAGTQSCLVASTDRVEQVAAYALLAKAYLALDRLELARETVAALLILDSAFQGNPVNDSQRFSRLVDDVRARRATVQVTSVSKSAEDLREAPATVMVVTAQEMARRGYMDLADVFHDLPGFDVSQTGGRFSSQVFMRGFRTKGSQGFLFLVDGVEQNAIGSNVAYISHQYSIANVDRVEVVYGPSSTMYGANAFLGVVNVITKRPDAFLADNRRVGTRATVTAGSWNTRDLDAVVAGRVASASYVLSARVHRSDEFDLSPFPSWDFDPAALRLSDYTGREFFRRADFFDPSREEFLASGFFAPAPEGSGFVLTELGAREALRRDREALGRLVGGNPLGYSDLSDDWSLNGKVEFPNLTVGVQSWRRREGAAAEFTERSAPGSSNGNTWVPSQTSLYLRYQTSLNRPLSLTLFSRAKVHRLEPSAHFRFFSVSNALEDRSFVPDAFVQGHSPEWLLDLVSSSSSQFRNEVTVSYDPGDAFGLVTGAELNLSSVQFSSDVEIADATTGEVDPDGFRTIEDVNNPFRFEPQREGQRAATQTVGLYVQASYKPVSTLRLVLGARFDDDRVSNRLPPASLFGGGRSLNSRAAVVYTPGVLTVKAIYAEASQDPRITGVVIGEAQTDCIRQYGGFFSATNQICGTLNIGNSDITSNSVASAKARNLEFAGSADVGPVALEGSVYHSRYSDAGSSLFRGSGDLGPLLDNETTRRVHGVQASARVSFPRGGLFANYTFTSGHDTVANSSYVQENGRRRVFDIARHRTNVGVHGSLVGRLRGHMRLNVVGPRWIPVGFPIGGTPPEQKLDGFVTANATLTYGEPVAGPALQLVVNNLFDASYVHSLPFADGVLTPRTIPQPGRSFFLRLIAPWPGW